MQRREEERRAAAELSARQQLQTPRSLKAGYVHSDDYQHLGARYNEALTAYRDLEQHLGSVEHRLGAVRGHEQHLLSAVDEQHEVISTVRQQVAGLSDSLGRLLGGVERSRPLMTLMHSLQDAPTPQIITGSKMMQEADVSRRLSSLEATIGEMAGAVASLSRSHATLAALASASAGRAGLQADRLLPRGPRERIQRLLSVTPDRTPEQKLKDRDKVFPWKP